jgi:glycosyltransferase involved in cell wall biosynthesis
MQADPLISVITVCRNSAATLARALQSMADQDWPCVEHIVIDGASKDETAKIIEQFRSRLALVLSEPDEGIYDAMNKGLDRANGDIVCFLNADDQYAANTVLSRVATLMYQHQLDALMGDVGFFHEANPQRMVRRYRSNHFTSGRLAWSWILKFPLGAIERVDPRAEFDFPLLPAGGP